ncbi:MAG: HD domain-containing protein [Planctomycetes bacterium]|nr:HD domain-containing protein [Planctomycetota bacterium]MCB9909622.1 HD domain-containing protein [Planctomycetota bacterium]MCB9911889.1 HD domain-containing protein [Planctomycetota bacterium]HPF14629.1 HD domain-containing protein [Planctomycetota bacterium]
MELVDALLALSRLDALPRTGWILAGVPAPERVAGHILGVGYLALALGPSVDPPLDMERVLAMALLHDAPECRTGDLPKAASLALPGGAKATMEQRMGHDLLAGFPPSARARLDEYALQDSPEARFVKGCDRLQLGLECLRLLRSGQRGLGDFVVGLPREESQEFAPLALLWKEVHIQLRAIPGPH